MDSSIPLVSISHGHFAMRSDQAERVILALEKTIEGEARGPDFEEAMGDGIDFCQAILDGKEIESGKLDAAVFYSVFLGSDIVEQEQVQGIMRILQDMVKNLELLVGTDANIAQVFFFEALELLNTRRLRNLKEVGEICADLGFDKDTLS